VGFFNNKITIDHGIDALKATRLEPVVQQELAQAEALAALRRQLADAEARLQDSDAKVNALGRSQAMVELALDGRILAVNDNFRQMLDYPPGALDGKNYGSLLEAGVAASPEYRQFWAKLTRGECVVDVFRYVARSGSEVWMRGTCNPVLDAQDRPAKVLCMGTDITVHRLRNNDTSGQLKALNKAMAVIEFSLDGNILHANENFTTVTGYALDEIKGRHHSMFVPEADRHSDEYRNFWLKLNRGEYDAGEYRRVNKSGKELWIHASYNPIFDAKGKLYKVVKFASDITAQKKLQDMIKQVMEDTNRVMGSLSAGRLSDRMAGQYTGEFVQLAAAINGYIDRLRGMVGEISDAAAAVKQGAEEIATGNANLSSRTEQQAATLEETSSAMEEMMSTVQQNAANADQAAQLARGAKQTAEKGGDIVRKAVVAMQAINGASSKINDIIGVIDEIAFQTNLLALNAAVEAARAGDQGRGFAVVADEVRSLAGRSATAAKEIKNLIKDSHEKVKEGTTLVNTSGQTLEEIVAAVKKVNDIIAEIATASSQQAGGLDEVNRSVNQMDQMTQQNAALVEEAAAASEALGGQAESLQQLISFFELGNGNRTR